MARITLREDRFATEASGQEYRALEAGDILYFPVAPRLLEKDEQAFLVTQRQAGGILHKNISYRPRGDRLKGVDRGDPAKARRAHELMRAFSGRAIEFMTSFLGRYAAAWKLDYASFRPIEEAGRKVPLHSRNDLLHFDSFPTRLSHGNRLLRIFLNVHPRRERIWVTSDDFEALAPRFAGKIGLTRPPGPIDVLKRKAVGLAAKMGLPVVDRPPYDAFMLRFHHAMKEDGTFQAKCRKHRWEFPSGSAWIVFTDGASHACLSGQYALEQTFIVHRASLTNLDLAPISVLERIAGYPLARRSA
jgi:hypothetical protein